MHSISRTQWIYASIGIGVFILTFFLFFRETQLAMSSLTAAILGTILIMGAMMTLSWFFKALK